MEPKSYYRIHESSPTVQHILNQSSRQSCFFTTYFNISFPSTLRSSKWFLYFRFPYLCQYQNSISLFSIAATCPAVLTKFYLTILITSDKQYKLWAHSVFNFCSYSFQHPVLKHLDPILYLSREGSLHTHTKQQTHLQFYVLFFMVLEKRKKSKIIWTAR
jgi:hypothetical protein